MYHLPNVHILQFTLLESGNALALAKDVLHWWHLILAVLAAGSLAWILGGRFLALGWWLRGMSAWPRRALLAGLTFAFAGLSILTLGWHRFQDPLPWDANWHRMFFQYGLMPPHLLEPGQERRLPHLPVQPPGLALGALRRILPGS